MALDGESPSFAPPGPLGSTNLRAALASARAAAAVPAPPRAPGPIEVRDHFFRPVLEPLAAAPQCGDPEAGPATARVTRKVPARDPEAGPANDRIIAKSPCATFAAKVARVQQGGVAGALGLHAGTRIETMEGPVPVEDLEPGMEVRTVDSGFVPIRWMARLAVPAEGRAAPVRFAPGVLGNTAPLTVAPMQRVVISGAHVLRIGGAPEALIAAHALVDGKIITRVPAEEALYFLPMLDDHGLIHAEGAAVGSFHPELDSFLAMTVEQIRDFGRMFPEIAEAPELRGPMARPVLTQLEAVALA